MTTWTLDHKTYNYYSTIGDLVVWGYPEYGDEVVINSNFSYIFKPSIVTRNKSLFNLTSLAKELTNLSTNRVSEILGVRTPSQVREETELEVYIRESNQFR